MAGSPGTCRGRPKGASASRTDASKVDPRQQEEFRRLLDFVRNALPGVQEEKADKERKQTCLSVKYHLCLLTFIVLQIALEAVGMPQRNIELSFDELWDLNVGGSMAPPSPLPEVEGGGASSSAPATVEAEADSSGIAAGPPSSGDESGSRSRTGTPTPSSSSYGYDPSRGASLINVLLVVTSYSPCLGRWEGVASASTAESPRDTTSTLIP